MPAIHQKIMPFRPFTISRSSVDSTAPAGLFPARSHAQSALLRIFSRARRRGIPLVIARLSWPPVTPSDGCRRFLHDLAVELRIEDLAWLEPGDGQVMLVLEDTHEEEPWRRRLLACAASYGVTLVIRAAHFPNQGLTLESLLEAVT